MSTRDPRRCGGPRRSNGTEQAHATSDKENREEPRPRALPLGCALAPERPGAKGAQAAGADGPRPAEEGPRRPEKDRREPRVRDALLRGRRPVRRRGERRRAADRPDERVGRGRHDDDRRPTRPSALGDQQDPNASRPPADQQPSLARGSPNSRRTEPQASQLRSDTSSADRTSCSPASQSAGRHGVEHERPPVSARRSGRGSMPGSGSRASPRPRTRGRAAARWFPPVSFDRRFRLWSRR